MLVEPQLSLRGHYPDQVRGCDLSPAAWRSTPVARTLASVDGTSGRRRALGRRPRGLGRRARLPRHRAGAGGGAGRPAAGAAPARRRRRWRRSGIDRLYSHQAHAWLAARSGRHLIVTTGTASGKTLAFNLPVLDALAREPKLRALYLYPTKALAQDQLRGLTELGVPRLRRGDLRRRHARRAALADPQVGQRRSSPTRTCSTSACCRTTTAGATCLPTCATSSSTRRTSTAASSARTSATSCAGCAGIARVYGAEPQLLLASATIANPAELAQTLAGVDAEVIYDDGAPRAERTVALWNPPLTDAELGLRASALGEASRLMAGLVEHGLRTLCFAKSRKAAELVHRFTADRLDAELAARLSPYRAGYTPAQRREIERRLVEGELLGVAATDALELGIDVGLLDAVISVGFPGTMSSLRQQWGRAGRRGHGLCRARRERGRARPVLHARAGDASAPPRRGRDPRPRERPRPRRPRPRGRVRGAARRAGRADPRRAGARAGGCAAGARAHEGRLGLERARLPGRPLRPSLRVARPVHDRRRGDRLRARHRRARARLLDGARRRDLPARRRVVPRHGARPRRRAPRSSSPSAATTTRRRRRRRRRRSARSCAACARSAATSSSAASP